MAAPQGKEHGMTSETSSALPPGWAESLLRMLLLRDDRESVSGDLLEEYRESIVPTLGRKADRWYVRQVASYVLRRAWVWGALIGVIGLTRYLFDSLAPVQYTPGVLHPRSVIMSDALMATFALASALFGGVLLVPIGLITGAAGAIIGRLTNSIVYGAG
jgi:hypothetical protein